MQQSRSPRETYRVTWTKNAIRHMREYGISERRIMRILDAPRRTEQGISPNTVGAMQPFGRPTKDGRHPYSGELWVLYKVESQKVVKSKATLPEQEERRSRKSRKVIIAVWRYPGVSKEREGMQNIA